MEIVNKATSCPFTAFDTHKWQLYPFSLTLCPPLIYFQIACHRFLENIYFGVEVPAVVGNIHFSQPQPALPFPDGPRVPRARAAGGERMRVEWRLRIRKGLSAGPGVLPGQLRDNRSGRKIQTQR